MPQEVKQIIANMNEYIILPIIDLLFALAVLIFIWGLTEFIVNSSKESGEREKGKRHMIWGIVGMFVMMAARPIIRIILGTFGIDTGPVDTVFDSVGSI